MEAHANSDSATSLTPKPKIEMLQLLNGNRDVLLEIASKLSNRALGNLSRTPLWLEIRDVIDTRFWFARCQFTTGLALQTHDYDWKRVYYAIKKSKVPDDEPVWTSVTCPRGKPGTRLRHGFDYLPSLLTLIEVHGEPDWPWDGYETECVWCDVTDVSILDWLLENKYLQSSVWCAKLCLTTACKNGHVSIAEHALDLISEWKDDSNPEEVMDIKEGIRTAQSTGAFCGQLAVLQMFERRGLLDVDMDLVINAMGSNNREVFEYILSKYEFEEGELDEIAVDAADDGLEQSFAVLLERGLDLTTLGRIFDDVLKRGQVEFVQMIVESGVMTLSVDWSEVAMDALEREYITLLRYALIHITESEYEADVYLSLVRAVITLPSAVAVVDWMTEKAHPLFVQAADDVVTEHRTDNPELVPIRALMMSFLYPETHSQLSSARWAGRASSNARAKATMLVKLASRLQRD